MRRASNYPAPVRTVVRTARRDVWPDPPARTGPTGWEVVLRFARSAPRVPSWSASKPNSTELLSGIPDPCGPGGRRPLGDSRLPHTADQAWPSAPLTQASGRR
jgi:hypothetical protein